MKKSVKYYFAVIGTIMLMTVSCSKDITESSDPTLVKHTCEMKLVGSLVNYDGLETKADANVTWTDGSVIYLRMNSPLGATTGEAVYNAETDVWTISYYGSLYEGVSNTCSAMYLEDKVTYENSLFTLDEKTVIYEDLEGSYIYDGGDLVVTANLKPKTGRIRFNGTAGSIIKVYGVTHYTTYDIGTDIYTTSAAPFKLTVGSDGYTPYFYGYFTDTEEPNVKVWIDAKEAYTRFCSKDIFNAGQSGKMTIPTADSHNGWVDGLYFNYKSVIFKMVAVSGGTFVMGDSNSTSEYYTPHNVTLTGFCIGEAEITYDLYYKIINSNTSSSYKNQPYLEYRNTYIKRINTLSKELETQFTLPTEAQWDFAAKGGVKHAGYTYSGSDNIDEIGWYTGNSGGKYKDVKLKNPNELGLYDMTGNAWEWTLDSYSTFTSESVIDPLIVTNSSYYIVKGGNYSSSSASCTNIYREYFANNTNVGARMVLNWDK